MVAGLVPGRLWPSDASRPEPRAKLLSPTAFGALAIGSLGCTTCFTSLTTVPAAVPVGPWPAIVPVPLEATVAPENASSASARTGPVAPAVRASAWTTVPVLYALKTALENGIGPAANDGAARPAPTVASASAEIMGTASHLFTKGSFQNVRRLIEGELLTRLKALPTRLATYVFPNCTARNIFCARNVVDGVEISTASSSIPPIATATFPLVAPTKEHGKTTLAGARR